MLSCAFLQLIALLDILLVDVDDIYIPCYVLKPTDVLLQLIVVENQPHTVRTESDESKSTRKPLFRTGRLVYI